MNEKTLSIVKTFTRLTKIGGAYVPWYLAIGVISIFLSLLSIAFVESVRTIINGAIEGNRASIIQGAMLGIGASLIKFLLNIPNTIYSSRLNNQSILKTQLTLLEKVLTTHHSVIAKMGSADIMNRVMSSSNIAIKGLNEKMLQFITTLMEICFVLTYFGWINISLSVGVICISLFIPLLITPLSKYHQRVLNKKNHHVAKSEEIVQDTFQGFEMIQTYGASHYMETKLHNNQNEVKRLSMFDSLFDKIYWLFNRIAIFGSMMFILSYGGLLVYDGKLDVGGLVAFLIASGQLTRPMQSLSGLWSALQEAISHAKRIFEIMDLPISKEKSNSDQLKSLSQIGTGDVQFNEVTFQYDETKIILEKISFTAKQGQITAIVGPSGMGKTTIINLLLKLYEPLSGHITYNNLSMDRFRFDEWRQCISLVPQDPYLFSGTIKENILLGNSDVPYDEMIQAAQLANAHSFIMSLEQGYDTHVDEQGSNLSGGERQRIILARSFVKQPKVLILDEPTSALDKYNEQLILQAIQKDYPVRVTIMVTHSPSVAKVADHIIYLGSKNELEVGAHAELMQKQGKYYLMFKENLEETADESKS